MQISHSGDDTPIKGKTACTKFTRLSTNGIHSLVLCEPVTGRTHQVSQCTDYMGNVTTDFEQFAFENENYLPFQILTVSLPYASYAFIFGSLW